MHPAYLPDINANKYSIMPVPYVNFVFTDVLGFQMER